MNLNDILTQVKTIITTNAEPDSNKKYNIFKVLGIQHKEVLICRLLGDLLNPNGFHNMGNIPLKLFFDIVLGIKSESEDLESAFVILEEPVYDKNNNSKSVRRADIVIHTNKHTYPIEVKIWADDQPKQLIEYYNYFFDDYRNAGIIYYLTPTGHKPSKDSQGDLCDEQVLLLSFEHDIKLWLCSIIEKCKDEQVKIIIEQFIDTVTRMQGDKKMINEINGLINFDEESRETVDALSFICVNADDILKNIRIKYLKRYIQKRDDFELYSVDNTPEAWGKQALIEVGLTSCENNINTWISLDGAGLYIITDAKLKGNGWTLEHDYSWKRIKSGDSNISLTSFEPKTIIIDSYIDEIINAINH